MSINKAQARLLSEDFLNTLGSDPNEFKPVECVTQALEIASDFVSVAQDNCPVHNGKLATSITVEEPKAFGRGGVSVEITMLAYGDFVDKGVKGTKGGAGKYAFKYDMPSKSMVKAMQEYIKTSKLSTANIKNRPISKHEIKNKRISDIDSAFALARSIKQHGIKALNFIGKAAQSVESKYSSILGDALVKDAYNAIPDKL